MIQNLSYFDKEALYHIDLILSQLLTTSIIPTSEMQKTLLESSMNSEAQK